MEPGRSPVEWQQDTESWAVFLQGTFNITENLSITAGVRYTEETKEVDAQTWLNSTAQGLATKTAYPGHPVLDPA